MSQIDLRGFSYPLASVQLWEDWKLREIESSLALLRQRERELADEVDDKLRQLTTAVSYAQDLSHKRMSPALHASSLRFIQMLNSEHLAAKRKLEELKQQITEELNRWISQRVQLNLLDEHRQVILDEFVIEKRREIAAESDRDWLARQAIK